MSDLSYKIESSIKMLNFYNDRFNPYHVAFSGGRDSSVLLWLVKKAKVDFNAFFYDNCLIHLKDRNHIKNVYPDVKILMSNWNLKKLVEIHKMLPTRWRGYCCAFFKESHNCNGIVLTGIRSEECFKRKQRYVFEFSRNSIFKFYKGIINPIKGFSNEDIKVILDSEKIPLSETYEKKSRNGCIGCPMQANVFHDLYDINPEYRIIWIKAVEVAWKFADKKKFLSAHDLFQWWLSGLPFSYYKFFRERNVLPVTIDNLYANSYQIHEKKFY